jgi:hypothetical protein
MIGAAIAELILGVRAERRSLESIAAPLTAIQRDRRLGVRSPDERAPGRREVIRAAGGQKISGPARPLFQGERSPTRSAGSLSPQRVVEITVHRTLPSY